MYWEKHLYHIALLLLLATICLTIYMYWGKLQPATESAMPPTATNGAKAAVEPPPPSSLHTLTFPIHRDNPPDPAALANSASGLFQPTASGRPESALYGSTRTGRRGKAIRATFHEGIDLAASRRDRQGRPLDKIVAIADGQTAYINRIAGNSNYGKYVVLQHTDPLGEFYSLYAHLAEIASSICAGQPVNAGQIIGRMGNTSSTPIPMQLGHLHLEIGMIFNTRFHTWYRKQKLIPDHGNFHGWNLLGIDPLQIFLNQHKAPDYTLRHHLAKIAPAFEVVLAATVLPDYFQRYVGLWHGAEFAPPALTVTCSENGVPLAGRNAAADESAKLGKHLWIVQNVNPEALGRNGAHLIYQADGRWKLSRGGEKWRNMLLHR